MASSINISSRVERVSPERATSLLEKVFSKGRIDQRLLQSYVREMKERRWILNGAPLVISDQGMVLDGRLRLLACVHADAPFDTLVVEGVSAASYETIDAVRKRTLGDVLSIRRERHGRALAAGLRIVSAYLADGVPSYAKTPSPTELLTVLERNPGIRDSVLPAMAAMPLLPHGCGIALHYLMSQVDPVKADRFISLIGEPASTGKITPIVHLRQVLADLRGMGGSRKQMYILAVAIKAWNAFHTGINIKLLRYSPQRERFPQIEGLQDSPGPLFEGAEISQGTVNPLVAAGDITARVVVVTPELAEQMLARNNLNRHVSSVVINKYARDMATGQWHLNGQTIKISTNGVLLDGQHRLEAVKKAKKPFASIIVDGLPESSFISLDTGRRRSVSDILRDRGECHTIILASALRWLWMIQNEVILSANSSPTNGELLGLLDGNENIRQSIKHVSSIREIMGSGIASALHYIFSQKDLIKSNEFFSRLIDGVQLSENSPIYHLRERLIRTRASHRVRLAEAERVALTIKAWNAFREARPIQLLSWRNKGPTRETLPVPV